MELFLASVFMINNMHFIITRLGGLEHLIKTSARQVSCATLSPSKLIAEYTSLLCTPVSIPFMPRQRFFFLNTMSVLAQCVSRKPNSTKQNVFLLPTWSLHMYCNQLQSVHQ